MTQGAIDLVQAELSQQPAERLQLLLDSPIAGPKRLAAEQTHVSPALAQPIAKYSWWDTGSTVCISIPASSISPHKALTSDSTQFSLQPEHLSITIASQSAPGQPEQRRLKINRLYAVVRPEASSCYINGCLLQHPYSSCSFSVPHKSDPRTSFTPLGTFCSHLNSLNAPPCLQPCSSNCDHTQVDCMQIKAPAAELKEFAAPSHKLLPMAAISGAATHKQKPAILITLAKDNPTEKWHSLERPTLSQQHKAIPPKQQDVAELRHMLHQHRRQKQQQFQALQPVQGPVEAADSSNLKLAHCMDPLCSGRSVIGKHGQPAAQECSALCEGSRKTEQGKAIWGQTTDNLQPKAKVLKLLLCLW